MFDVGGPFYCEGMSTTTALASGEWSPDPSVSCGDECCERDAEIDAAPDRDVWSSGEAHEEATFHLEGVTVRARILVAEQWAGIAAVLRDAAECTVPWLGDDSSVDPLWEPPAGQSLAAYRRERREFSVRAAVADLAVRLGMSETMVRTRADHVETLRHRCPSLWLDVTAGLVSEMNAATAAQQVATLPHDAPASWAEFEEALQDAASRLSPGKFRLRARVVRERVHPESIDERHERARPNRDVWITPEADGMAMLSALLPASDAHAAYAGIDGRARHLRGQGDEERTLAQLRADVFSDLMSSSSTTDAVRVSRASTVSITIPVLTMLGHSDEPATLDGYGPIDLDTAKRLAGEASSWIRVLTHPVTGPVLDLDRKTYRVPKALRRWLGARDKVCIFPGCTHRAAQCHIDHREEWQQGGATSADNLAPLCEPHHVVKTKTEWNLYRDEATGARWWVSPTAQVIDCDPPPW